MGVRTTVMAKRVKLGKVIDAIWDCDSKAVRFTMEFANGMKMQATCPAGYDPASGAFIPSDQLRSKAKKFIGMTIYDQSGKINPRKMSREDLATLRFNISLNDMNIGVSQRAYTPDANTFLSRLF